MFYCLEPKWDVLFEHRGRVEEVCSDHIQSIGKGPPVSVPLTSQKDMVISKE